MKMTEECKTKTNLRVNRAKKNKSKKQYDAAVKMAKACLMKTKASYDTCKDYKNTPPPKPEPVGKGD